MRRFSRLILLPLLLQAGCKIEQTPSEYIDRLETPEQEVQASREELIDRLLSTAPSLQRRNMGDVAVALAPHPELATVGPDATMLTGNDGLTTALSTLTSGRRVTMGELAVHVGPANNVAWFSAVYETTDGQEVPERVPFSGVFVREEGEWRLRQSHLSAPISPPPADSLENQEEAPPEGG